MTDTITTACPSALWLGYAQLRRSIAPDEHTADNPPSGVPSCEKDGVKYVVSSMPRTDWTKKALEDVTDPEWGADVVAAQQAQAALVVWPDPNAADPGEPPLARPDKITVIIGMPGKDAITAMGLTRIEADDVY